MKNKIIGILICTLLITTSAAITVESNENEEIIKLDNKAIDYETPVNKLNITNNNFSTLGDGFVECVAACMGITLAGNCIYLIFGCAISPGPHNFCCWAAPIFCGVDIGLLLSCISKCMDKFGYIEEEPPCFPPHIIRLVELIQDNNSSGPAIILGIMCLFQHLQDIKEWLKEQGYVNIDRPFAEDCGCLNES